MSLAAKYNEAGCGPLFRKEQVNRELDEELGEYLRNGPPSKR